MRVNQEVKARTRRALLDSAAQAFAQDGFHDANIDRVSESAGLAKGTVYNYFASKQAIFEEVLTEACALAAGSAEAVPDGAPTQARLEAFVEGNLAWARSNPALAVVLARELIGGSADTRELILDASAPCIAKVADILDDAAAAGELSLPGPSAALGLTFIVLANALLIQADGGSGWPDAEALAPTVSRLFLQGVADHGRT